MPLKLQPTFSKKNEDYICILSENERKKSRWTGIGDLNLKSQMKTEDREEDLCQARNDDMEKVSLKNANQLLDQLVQTLHCIFIYLSEETECCLRLFVAQIVC